MKFPNFQINYILKKISIAIMIAISIFVAILIYDYYSYPKLSSYNSCNLSNDKQIIYVKSDSYKIIGGIRSDFHLEKNQYILTFDDGPLPLRTSKVVNVLVQNCVGATFFTVGVEAMAFPWLVTKIRALGFSVGSHTFFHRPLDSLSQRQADFEMRAGFYANDLSEETKNPKARLFRFPKWAANDRLIALAHSQGAVPVFADITPEDWRGYEAEVSFQKFLRQMKKHDRGIIVLHDVQKNTPLLLEKIIKYVRSRGGKFLQIEAVDGPQQ